MAPCTTRRVVLRRGAATGAAAALAGCLGVLDGSGSQNPSTDAALAVSSKNFVENEILGYVALEALRANVDATVSDEIPSGDAPTNWEALRTGTFGVYWEYTGTQYEMLPPERDDAPRDPEALYDRVVADAAEQGVTVFERAPFDNSFSLLAPREWQAATGVETLSDLAAHVNSGNTDLTIALGEDFAGRDDGWRGLVDHYGFDDDAVDALGDHLDVVPIGITYELFQRGDATVVMGFATDPQISDLGLRVLDDDRSFFPPYNPAPMAHADTIERIPGAADVLDSLGPALDGRDQMRSLNARVVFGDATPHEVATDFVRTEGLV